jgi:hypothetical protein
MAELDRLKLKFTPWYCDKEPYGFVSFMQSNTAVMRSLNCGAAIEDYLDIKLGRTAVQNMMVSSIINDDPDFALPIEMPAQAESQGEVTTGDTELLYSSVNNTTSAAPASTVSGQSKRSQATTILPSAGSYYSLSTGARQLDVVMYSVLLCNVIGTKRCVIECVKEHSYIQGMCLLYKHCDITRNDRISRAFNGMDNIRFGGDAQVWATTCIMSHRELHDSKASMRHYSLQKIMHSLDGKAKTVQYRIAEDMNALSADDTINIYDLIQEYASWECRMICATTVVRKDITPIPAPIKTIKTIKTIAMVTMRRRRKRSALIVVGRDTLSKSVARRQRKSLQQQSQQSTQFTLDQPMVHNLLLNRPTLLNLHLR